jgi:hypothetical protein
MPNEIKLTEKDIHSLEERLKKPTLPPDEKALIEALLQMAKNHRVQGEGDVAWFFMWQ